MIKNLRIDQFYDPMDITGSLLSAVVHDIGATLIMSIDVHEYVYVNICIYIFTNIYIYIYVYVYMHIHMYTYMAQAGSLAQASSD